MNKKDIAHIRRQCKLDHDLLKIYDILNVYIMKESTEIYHYECQPFALLERDKQELYMGNFKRTLAGEPGQKLFELKFRPALGSEAGAHAQHILHEALLSRDAQDWMQGMLRMVEKMLAGGPYEQDTVVTFVRGEYYKPTVSRSEETEENERDEVYNHPFLLCSVNSTEPPRKALLFDYVEREFKSHIAVDPMIKLTSPVAGFFFPSITDNASDVNRILYCAGKAHEPDGRFIEEVLQAEKGATAREERAIFEEVVKEVAGESLEASTLAHVYEEVHRMIEAHEEEEEDGPPPTLDVRDVERVLTASGVEGVTTDKVEKAFQYVVDDKHRELAASSIMPKFASKSIKIETKVATISVSPQDLKYVKQVQYHGKRCILIEVDEDAVVEGFTLTTETL